MMAITRVIVLLCFSSLVLTAPTKDEDEIEVSEDFRVRHGRFAKLDYLFHKISKLDEIMPSGGVDIHDAEKMEDDREPPLDEEDLDDDVDYDEEIKMIQRADSDLKPQRVKDLVDHYIRSEDDDAEWSSDDPSQEDYDQDWEFDQADSPTTMAPNRNWRYYGPRDYKHGRVQNKLKQSEIFEAVQHTLLILQNATCKEPKQRVVNIQNIFPNPSKTYIPHCTLLNRCGDDAGCCKTDSMTCGPKTAKIVEKYFYTTTVGNRASQVEKLSFVEHIECECVSKQTDMMNDDETFTLKPVNSGLERKSLDIPEVETDSPISLKRCKCPTEFSVYILDDGNCQCGCFNKDCMKFKKGKEHFGMKDRICILKKECQIPVCEFGDYIQDTGRCPKKQKKTEDLFKHSRIFRNT